MTSKHTPGPWAIDQWGQVYGYAPPVDGVHKSVRLVDPRSFQGSFADRLLIMSAPDLLAVARECLRMIEQHAIANSGDIDAIGYLTKAASAAIAKAKGE